MTELWEQPKQKLDLSEIESYQLSDYPYIPIEYNSSNKKLRRVIAIGEILKIIELVTGGLDINVPIEERLANLKADYLVFDAKYLYGLGYKNIYFKDLMPGDIIIAYELRIED